MQVEVKNDSLCQHCSQEIPRGVYLQGFCCIGCKSVFALIHELGFDRYYDLRDQKTLPLVHYLDHHDSLLWLPAYLQRSPGQLTFKIEGLQCSACIWLVQHASKQFGTCRISINVATATLHIQYDASDFKIEDYLRLLQAMGYYLTPATQTELAQHQDSDRLLLRLGICLAIAMNSMFFSFSIYLGLTADSVLYTLMMQLNFLLSIVAVWVGGSYFLKRAWIGLRNKLIHFDMPIALGLGLTFIFSVYQFVRGQFAWVYFDTLNVFIALMLLSRFVQNRWLVKNRQQVSAGFWAENFNVKKIQDHKLLEVPFTEVKKGDCLWITQNSFFPVNILLIEDVVVECSLKWIHGESMPSFFKKGDVVLAGAQLVSGQSVKGLALDDFQHSTLATMLVVPEPQNEFTQSFWHVFAKYYVTAVLVLAFWGAGIWFVLDSDKVIPVFISILVVTCPCSLGLTIPMARSMAMKQMAWQGVFIQKWDVLDRLLKVKKIFFDKTGTLTFANLKVVNQDFILHLDEHDKKALFAAVAQSGHPASRSIYEFLKGLDISLVKVDVQEVLGLGLHFQYLGNNYFLGKSENTHHASQQYSVLLKKNGHDLNHIHLQEEPLFNVKSMIENLKAMQKQLYLMSGDTEERVKQFVKNLGFQVYLSACSPEQKAQFLLKYDQQDTLMIGDGMNDLMAMQCAWVSGTPVLDQRHLAKQSDFYFMGQNFDWLPQMFDVATKLKNTVHANFGFALLYNLFVLSLAFTAHATPLVCAIVMPLSSVVALGMTLRRMR